MTGFNRLFALFSALLIISCSANAAIENKIKFDNQTYNLSNPESKSQNYIYLLKNENIGNWHSKLYKEILDKAVNPVEAAGELAYEIQKQNPKAVVLVYPEAATLGYLTFDNTKKYYEYNVIVFKNKNNLSEKLGYAKRFYSSSNGGQEGARQAAVLFAEKNNKKYMEMINRLSLK